jgi:peptide/nickel transport system substrate-binding protein
MEAAVEANSMRRRRVVMTSVRGAYAVVVVLAYLGLSAGAALTAEAPVRGGTLTVALVPEPSHLNSAFDTSPQVVMVSTKTNEGLLSYDLDLNPVPQLAESWKVSPDGLRITFNLRHGVHWHDGKEFTSADVEFSVMKVWRELHGRGASTFAAVSAVETPDPYTAVFVLSRPAPYIVSALAGFESLVIAKHIYDGTNVRANPANSAPVGTGPFRFKSWSRGGSIILERNPDYWAPGKPYLDQIVFSIMPDASARAAALESNQAMMVFQSMLPLSDAKRLSQLPNLELTTAGYTYQSTMMFLEFNLDNATLHDTRVRQAIAHALDRDFVTENIWYGFGETATGPIHQALNAFYSSKVPRYTYNPDRANKLLDEAGLPRNASGARLNLTLDVLPFGDQYVRTAEYLRQALADIGIIVNIRAQDFPSFIKHVYADRAFDLNLVGASNSPDPTIGVQRFYWSKAFKPGVAFTNSSHYNNPRVDEILEKAQVESDVSKRRELFAEFQSIVMTDLPIIPITAIRQVTLTNKRVRDHSVTADGVFSNFASVWLAPK